MTPTLAEFFRNIAAATFRDISRYYAIFREIMRYYTIFHAPGAPSTPHMRQPSLADVCVWVV
eukprot:6549490-Prymnesium_polylepis.1